MKLDSIKWWKEQILMRMYDVILPNSWTKTDSFVTRKWKSYDEYVKVQQTKLKYVDLTDYDVKFREHLSNRVEDIFSKYIEGNNVLCLAARIGTEVKAFRDGGYFAWGLDLNPGKKNQYVVTGDFHKIPLADESVDAVYTNSLDHSFNLDKVLGEVKRLLSADGVFILEASLGFDGGGGYGIHESVYWKDMVVLRNILFDNSFDIIKEYDYTFPCTGKGFICTKRLDDD